MGGRFRAWCENTSCHGWAEWSRNKTLGARLFWAAFLFLSLAFLGQQMSLTFMKLAEDEKWVTSVYEKRATQLEFPNVIICNMNTLNRTKAVQKWSLNDSHISYINSHFNTGLSFQGTKESRKELQKQFALWRQTTKNDIPFADLVYDLGHECEATFAARSFFFNNQQYWDKTCEKHVEEVRVAHMGKCLKIKPPKNESNNYTAAGTGLINGLSFFLSVAYEDHVQGVEHSYLGSGFFLFLQYDMSWPAAWIALSPGFRNFIALRAREAKITEQFSSFRIFDPPCSENGRLKMLANVTNYSRHACDFDCYLQAVYKECGCTPLLNIPPYRPCEELDLDECLQPNSSLIGRLSEQCAQSCIEACVRRSVRARSSVQKFPSPHQIRPVTSYINNLHGHNYTEEYVRTNFVAVDVFFETTAVQVVAWYEKMPFNQIVSNLGGQLGLAAGISILTIAQILWYAFINVKKSTHTKIFITKSVQTTEHPVLGVRSRGVCASDKTD